MNEHNALQPQSDDAIGWLSQDLKNLHHLHAYPQFYRTVFARVCLFFKGPEKKMAWLTFLGSIICLCVSVALQGRLNFWYRDFWDAIQHYDVSRFWREIWVFLGLATLHITIAVVRLYLMGLLVLRWRRFMTQHYVKHWLSERAYYFLHVLGGDTDNPDQRLAEDMNFFTTKTLELFFIFLEAALMLAMFLGILWEISGSFSLPLGDWVLHIPGYLVFVALFYAALGTWITQKTIGSLLPLDFQKEKLEGNFRYSLMRIRENVESVSFFHGEEREEKTLALAFQQIYKNSYAILRKMLGINMWIYGYGQAALAVPILVLAPRIFAEKLTIGFLQQVFVAFGKVEESFSVLVKNYPHIVSWKASTLRVLTFEAKLKDVVAIAARSSLKVSRSAGEGIHLEGLVLQTTQGRTIISFPKSTLRRGESVLIRGNSGAGKSTFLRALAGLWPFGEGEIKVPATASLFFLPQRPYIPLGTLADALTYPGKGNVSQATLADLLTAIGLKHLCPRLKDIDSWSTVLSGGEQQRLGFGRLMLQKPDWAFLDESTSALDEEAEAGLYRLVRESCPNLTLLSVGHRDTLIAFHDRVWDFQAH